MSALNEWLGAGAAPEADWPAHVRRLAARGALGWGAAGLLLDLPALAQPHACRPSGCAPGFRGAGARSCCADLDVEPSASEAAAIDAALPEVAAFLATRDPRWSAGAPPWLERGVFTRPGGSCVFATPAASGFSCGLHALEAVTDRARGTLKPMPCRLFPLVVVDLGDDTILLTAVHGSTARYTGLPARRFPCLVGGEPTTLARAAEATLAELWGAPTARRILRAVGSRPRPPSGDAPPP